MATFNRAHFISAALLSIQAQTHIDFECIIIDDGSTDDSEAVIKTVIYGDPRFRYFKRTKNYKKGLPGCRNFGLDLAVGSYIIFFDDDDIVHPDNLKICLRAFREDNIDFVHYKKKSFTELPDKPEIVDIIKEKELTKSDFFDVLTQKIGLASCTVMWKADCFKMVRFKENLTYAEEWECYLRILSHGKKGLIISNVLYFNRKHLNSNTGEYYLMDPIRRNSHSEAVVMVMANLSQLGLLTHSIVRYLVVQSYYLRECNGFLKLLQVSNFSEIQKIRWQFFYKILPLRLSITRLKVKIENRVRR